MQPIRKVLVANRGEIARRVMRTCRRLGIATVAVFSDADEGHPFVLEADEAFRLGPAESSESYLNVERLLLAARRTGADAIHPGYGFLAENATFAEACADAGVVFIGPTPDAIRRMGSKQEAKSIMAEAGVPVIPGYDGANQDPEVLAEEAEKIGFPVLVKASAGGGGKGMKRVDGREGLRDAILSAKREAEGAFGDGTLLIEKYVERPRHVEIQILGDAHGALVHLNERECSIQRRHQKVLEESPSPALNEELRAEMGAAAIKAGEAIGYQNAGTVEFILAPDGSFYFLEVNTRLQVEHPVTECITGLDLVEEQIRIAEGHPLAFSQQDVPLEGAAVEVRLYAEDPDAGFLPQSGTVFDFFLPSLEGVRVDGGIEAGTEVSVHYDPMLAKIIAWGDDRNEALRRLGRALDELIVAGIRTNREFLRHLLRHPELVAGRIDTRFIDREAEALIGIAPKPEEVARAACLAALADHDARRREATILPALPSGFRNNRHLPQWVEYERGAEEVVRVEYHHRPRGRFEMKVGEHRFEFRPLGFVDGSLLVEEDGHRYRARVSAEGERWHVLSRGIAVALRERPRFPLPGSEQPAGACVAPMPGKVVEVKVAEGDPVKAGQLLLVLEAMKMEHTVTAPHDGVVGEVHVAAADQVEADAVLLVVAESD